MKAEIIFKRHLRLFSFLIVLMVLNQVTQAQPLSYIKAKKVQVKDLYIDPQQALFMHINQCSTPFVDTIFDRTVALEDWMPNAKAWMQKQYFVRTLENDSEKKVFEPQVHFENWMLDDWCCDPRDPPMVMQAWMLCGDSWCIRSDKKTVVDISIWYYLRSQRDTEEIREPQRRKLNRKGRKGRKVSWQRQQQRQE